jgi:hypothetical protein
MRGLGLSELWVLGRTSVAGISMSHAVVSTNAEMGFFVKSKTIIMKDLITISPELKRFMELHKIPNLISLLQIEDEILLGMTGFGWRMMREVLELRKPY